MSTSLELISYHGEVGPFPVSSVIVAGEHEAVLIDAQFTLADAHRVVALILASGKDLTTVYVSHGDPDFYFGLGVVAAAFPGARIVASEPTVDHITHSVKAKLTTWGPQLGLNGPSNVLIPAVLADDYIELEGRRLEIHGLSGETPDRSYVWIPDLAAVVGGVVVYGGLHLFTADTPTPEARAAWGRALGSIEALSPEVVIPGHSAPGFAHDLSSVVQSRHYLEVFEERVQRATSGQELIEAMNSRFPEFGLEIALQLGAKVAKGEMSW